MRRVFVIFLCLFLFLSLSMPAYARQDPTPRPTALPVLTITNLVVEQVPDSNSIQVTFDAAGLSGRYIQTELTLLGQPSWQRFSLNSLSPIGSSGSLSAAHTAAMIDTAGQVLPAGTYSLMVQVKYSYTSETPTAQTIDFDFQPVEPPTLMITSVSHTPGTNAITVTTDGTVTPDVASISYRVKTSSTASALVIGNSESPTLGDFTFTTEGTTGYPTNQNSDNVLAPGEYLVEVVLYTASSSRILSFESSPFTVDAPYLSITDTTYDAGSNSFNITYTAHSVGQGTGELQLIDGTSISTVYNTIRFDLSGGVVDQTGTINISADAVPFYANLSTAYVAQFLLMTQTASSDGAAETTLSLAAASPSMTYQPATLVVLWWLVRYYWYITALFVLFIAWIVLRQVNWMRRVENAPLALTAPQRHRVIKRKIESWKPITDLDTFVKQLGKPGGRIPEIVSRVQTLQAEPDNFRTLRQSMELARTIYLARSSENRLSPAKTYRNFTLDHLVTLISTQRSDLLKRYWELSKGATQFGIKPAAKSASALDSLLNQLENARAAAVSAQEALQPYAADLTEASELESVQYLGELAIDLREIRANTVDNLGETDVALERILTRLNGYVNALPANENVYESFNLDYKTAYRKSDKLPVPPLRVILKTFVAAIEAARASLVAYRDEVIAQLQTALKSVDNIEAIPTVERTLNAVKGDRFGSQNDLLQVSLDMLDEIVQDVNSASSHTGYYRRLYLQDAHIKTRDLYARVKNELSSLADPLLKMAQLFEEQKQTDITEGEKTYRSPYVLGKPVRADKVALFKGRSTITAAVINRLRDRRGGTMLLYGARRMGKSSFLYHLENLLPTSHIPVYVDCQGGTTQDDGSFFYEIARRIYAVLRKRDPAAARLIPKPDEGEYITLATTPPAAVLFDEAGAPILTETDEAEEPAAVKKKNPAARLEDWLSDHVSTELRSRVLLITLDEFEEIGNAIRDGRMTLGVLKQLRHMIQHSEYLAFMFAGVAKLDVLIHNAASYFISVTTIELSYLEDAAAEALICRPYQPEDPTIQIDPSQVGRVPNYDDNAVAEIKHLTRNQPFLIQIVCEMLIGIANEEQLERITIEHVQRVAPMTFTLAEGSDTSFTNYFDFYWQNWDAEGQAVLRSILIGEALPNDEPHRVQQTIDDMIRHRLIEQRADGSYAVEVPLMEMYLRTKI